MKIEDRMLFLRYALPCAGTLIRRGNVTQQYVDNLIKSVSNDIEPEGSAEKMFIVANAMCNHFAREMKKRSIDSEVIRRYFLIEHSRVVDERYELMKDFDPVDCKTYLGKVLKVNNGHATLETRLGKRSYRTDFVKDLREGDNAVVHWDFVVEKISEALAKKMKMNRAKQ